jgi:hypothetical protein
MAIVLKTTKFSLMISFKSAWRRNRLNMVEDKEKEDTETLEDFIKEHEKILTIIGVFGALTAFFTTVKSGEALIVLSYLIFLLLCFELSTKFPKLSVHENSGMKSIGLFLFQILLYTLMFAILFYVIVTFSVSFFVFAILFALLAMIFYWSAISLPFNNYLGKHKKTSKLLVFVLDGLFFVGLCLLIIFIFVIFFVILVHFGVIHS